MGLYWVVFISTVAVVAGDSQQRDHPLLRARRPAVEEGPPLMNPQDGAVGTTNTDNLTNEETNRMNQMILNAILVNGVLFMIILFSIWIGVAYRS